MRFFMLLAAMVLFATSAWAQATHPVDPGMQAQVSEAIHLLARTMDANAENWAGWLLAAVPFIGVSAPWIIRLLRFLASPLWAAMRGPLLEAWKRLLSSQKGNPPTPPVQGPGKGV